MPNLFSRCSTRCALNVVIGLVALLMLYSTLRLGPDIPLLMLLTAVVGVALIGLPPSGTFLAKWQLIAGSVQSGQWWWIPVIAVGSLLAGAYVFRVLGYAFGPAESVGRVVQWAREEIPALLLALFATVVLGLGAAGVWELIALDNQYPGARA